MVNLLFVVQVDPVFGAIPIFLGPICPTSPSTRELRNALVHRDRRQQRLLEGDCAIIQCNAIVEPLSNDHPHQRPSILYDHISCDGQCFLFVRSLTIDHPSNATNDRVRWNFLPRGLPHLVFQNDCGMNVL